MVAEFAAQMGFGFLNYHGCGGTILMFMTGLIWSTKCSGWAEWVCMQAFGTYAGGARGRVIRALVNRLLEHRYNALVSLPSLSFQAIVKCYSEMEGSPSPLFFEMPLPSSPPTSMRCLIDTRDLIELVESKIGNRKCRYSKYGVASGRWDLTTSSSLCNSVISSIE